MAAVETFAARIRERYPDGLTGIFAVGGTRTTYILSRHRQSTDPGKIDDFGDYAQFLIDRYQGLMTMFFELGGQHIIIPVLEVARFTKFGTEYAQMSAEQTLIMAGDKFVRFYSDNDIDPYFVGVDTLLHLTENEAAHRLGATLEAFQRSWPAKESHRKVVWEIAPIPLFSIWRSKLTMSQEEQGALDAEIASTRDLEKLYQLTYKFYARAAYGVDIPLPSFYVGSNRNGTLKLRAMMAQALMSGDYCRMYYLPYPSLFMKRATLQAILDDLAFGKRRNVEKMDYSGQYTPEEVKRMYDRITQLSDDPASTLGFPTSMASTDAE